MYWDCTIGKIQFILFTAIKFHIFVVQLNTISYHFLCKFDQFLMYYQ